ncbi:MAG TPA: AAA family ATPase, partial [Solirubrobacteraceae bacterium]|nr:AAA family ATPase [Solirubrobacteraceae bacterium]
MSTDRALVEREGEVEQLRRALGAARAGDGAVIVVEAPAGHGKTELLRVLRAEAASAGMRVLGATGAELERDFPFGLVLQLFEGEIYGAGDERRAALFAGAAQSARP